VVAIMGCSFGSMGDIASKGTGGGLISMNCEGPTKFISPGSFTVKIEGKNVHLLSDLMFNNNGPAGSPPNSATMMGLSQSDARKIQIAFKALCAEFCAEIAKGWESSAKLEQRLSKSQKLRDMGLTFPPQSHVSHVFNGVRRLSKPDALLRSDGKILQCFDFKGPKDRWRGDQYARQTRLAKRVPKEVSQKTCGC
jgi:hypothetical protein